MSISSEISKKVSVTSDIFFSISSTILQLQNWTYGGAKYSDTSWFLIKNLDLHCRP